ncbi:MAG: acyltransferase [Petrimonas sp.]|nr:acyltransferase [Petrimonas sp.]MEA5080306.1 acyltransferase [Dysgonamonadaceae bacterium]
MKKIFIKLIHDFYKKIKSLYFNYEYNSYRTKYEIHPSFRFNGENIIFYGSGKILIDENSYIGHNSTIQSAEACLVKIGRNCSISHNVKIYTSSNDPDQIFESDVIKQKKGGNVLIGNGVWIGVNVFINPGICIGDNVVIGANSVVTKNIEDNCIVGGVPARFIRKKCIKNY